MDWRRLMDVRRLITGAAMCGLLVAAACAGPRQLQPPRTAGAAQQLVSVHGYVGLFGGPLNAKTRRMALNNSPDTDARVTVWSAGRRLAETVTGADGRFLINLMPGRYTVRADCGQATPLVVTAAQARRVMLSCDVP
jgi:hypothetical protein